MAVCPHCGTMLEHDARFCGACGKRIEPIAATAIGLPSPVVPSPSPSPSPQAAPRPARPAPAPTLVDQQTNPALASTFLSDLSSPVPAHMPPTASDPAPALASGPP